MYKHLSVASLMGVILLLSGTSYAGGIVNSAHDLSGETWSDGEICKPCHTPHNADTSVTAAPLWNHEVTTSNFTLYSSGTLDATMLQTSGVSLLCLSCHDGTIALDSFGGNQGTQTITGDANLGTDLSNDHPVSFVYNAALASADGSLMNPETVNSGLGGTIEEDMLFGTQAGQKTMECASCHDVHNKYGNANLLRKTNASSALCLTCHDL